MKILKNLGDTARGLWSLLVGLKITGGEFFRPWLTTRYPYQEVPNLDTFRGHIDLVARDDDPRTPRCIMCGKCREVCPSGCILIKMRVKEDKGSGAAAPMRTMIIGQGVELPFSSRIWPPADSIERELEAFRLDYNYCSLCGLCVQSCPVGSLQFSRDVYLAGTARKDFEFDLLQRIKDRPALREARKSA